ncbi:MAG: branched-chain amino acid transaminase [Blastocatellia bacterium]|nr:branched-chain amino acid transaminase [Blastocatellia bacterium]
MTIQTARIIWHNGNLLDWDDARIHVMTHGLNHASVLFEGIRCYATPRGPAFFRLRDHLERLYDSCKVYRMEPGWSVEELTAACIALVEANQFSECYLRPLVFRGYGSFGINPLASPVEVYIASWRWETYLGPEALEHGIDACVSSWTRMTPNSLPPTAKAAANYMNSQLITLEAQANGFAEGIALDQQGMVSEGSAQNIFLVRGGEIHTPPSASSILPGITRDSVMQIARRLGYRVREEAIPRAALYLADEIFFTGTATEITPVRSIDRISIGRGMRGPITTAIQSAFFAITGGRQEAPGDWLTFARPISTR